MKKSFSVKNFCLVSAIVLFVLILDLLTKKLTDGVYNNTIINGFLSFHSAHNTGAAWSFMAGNTIWLIVISVVFLALIFIYNHFATEKNLLYYIAYSFILGGAIGNLIDRVFLGYVRDFIRADFMNFPIFNIADSFLSVGVVLFCVFFIFCLPKMEKKKWLNTLLKKKTLIKD